MAGSPDWKIYVGKEYRACCKYAEDAAALVAFLGNGTTVRWGHSWIVWREGLEAQPAGESYDGTAAIMWQRVRERQIQNYAKHHGGQLPPGMSDDTNADRPK
jgi:hypothetical protein